MTKVAIVGGGISGCSIGRILQSEGFQSVLFEKGKLGGLVACTFESGHTYHRVGGHVFNSKLPDVLAWFWKHFDQETEFLLAKRNAVILLDGKFISYPIELNLSQLPAAVASTAIKEILAIAKANPSTSYHDFEAFLRGNFGNALCDQYFTPYNRKIWHRDLATIPLAWLDGKLPMISPAEIIEKNILKLDDNMVHSSFYYPKRGGSQFIINRLAEELAILYEDVASIHLKDGTFTVNETHGGSQAIVYTGDIRQLPDILTSPTCEQVGFTEERIRRLRALDSNGTTTLLCECDKNDYSWVYLPGPETKCHRIIMTGNFSPENSASDLPANRTTCTVEYSGHLSEEEMRRELLGLPFGMKPIAYNYCQNSYIIHDEATASLMRETTQQLAVHGIFCCGRFAEWQYYNMDAAIASAFDVASKLSRYFG
jgi:protoporphyrinogen oxidase